MHISTSPFLIVSKIKGCLIKRNDHTFYALINIDKEIYVYFKNQNFKNT